MKPISIAIFALGLGCTFSGCSKPQETVRPSTPPPAEVKIAPIEPPPCSQWNVTASDVQEDVFPAKNACDGDPKTRWSSPSSDPQWLEIDLRTNATVCGVNILWETAYSSEYSLQTSPDRKQWTTVYSTKSGDGNTDDVYFRPTTARYIKLLSHKRGTGWGNSIWEMSVKGPSKQVRIESAGQAPTDQSPLFDGDENTIWTSATPPPASTTVDLREEKALGGIRIDWGDNYATALDLFASRDGSAWTKMGELRNGTGNFDLILCPRFMARYLRVDITAAAEAAKPVQIREISLRGMDETLTPLAAYQIAAEKVRPGLYPDSLRKRQVYWTIIGQPGDRQESLIDEYGNIEPKAGSCSLMPYVFADGRLCSAFDASSVTQTLDSSYLPIPSVSWNLKSLTFSVEAIARGPNGASATYARYTLRNSSGVTQTGVMFLAVRPVQVNPPWQFGGLSNIRSLEATQTVDGTLIKVNGNDQFISITPPQRFGARPFDRGDVAKELVRGELPGPSKMENAGDLISGALSYPFNLKPGESMAVVVAMPLFGSQDNIRSFVEREMGETPDPNVAFDRIKNDAAWFWREQIDKVVFEVPDRDIGNTLKSQLAYILINRDGVAIQPGSRNYKRSWIRDGCLTSAAMLRMGLTQPVREYLDWYAERVQADGLVPPILNNDGTVNTGFGSNQEYDSQGEFIFAIMEFYRFTGDRDFLQKHYDQVRRAMQYLVTLRSQTLAPDHMKDEPARERFVGILPTSFSHEGYAPPMHSYWDDFFALKGWKDGAAAADVLGDTNTAAWAREQYRLLQESVKASIEKTIAFKNIDFIPGCAEKGDMDATSTTIAFFPCEEQSILPETTLRHTYDRYFADVKSRLEPGWSAAYTPYEIRNLSAFVRLDEKDRANFLLDYIMSCRRPPSWNHLAEVVLGDPRMGSYIGDMPHTWVGSGYINAVRGMVVRESDGRLVLLAGAPEKWVRDGNGIRLERLPTHFGTLHLTAKADGKTLAIHLDGTCAPPNGYDLRWPMAGKPARVVVDGKECADFSDRSCNIPAGAKVVTVDW